MDRNGSGAPQGGDFGEKSHIRSRCRRAPAGTSLAQPPHRDGGVVVIMTCQCVEFAHGQCLIEIEPQPSEAGQTRYVARMSVLEEAGSIVRPLFGQDGRRIKIFATSERLAMRVAVSYLEGRFGRRAPREQACELGESTVGVPFVTH
jgi:hypothetical protein